MSPPTKPIKGEVWKRNDIWSGWHGEYRGSVTAGKGASLSGLAYMATRNAEDWRDLGLIENVEIGQVIEIAPLLKKFEMRVRASVVEATKQFKATGFPPADNPGLVVSALIDGSAAKTVNQYFSKTGKLPSDCAGAGLAVLQKGLLNVIGNNLFNLTSRTPDGGSEVLNATKEDLTDNMWFGDMVQLPNYDDWENYHPNPETWAWRGENVIKVGNDRFWGYIGTNQYTVKPKQEWNDLLREAFNSLNGPKRQGNIPGLSQKQTIFFPDIAAIAMKLFDARSKKF